MVLFFKLALNEIKLQPFIISINGIYLITASQNEEILSCSHIELFDVLSQVQSSLHVAWSCSDR
jgi:hypothetical protein